MTWTTRPRSEGAGGLAVWHSGAGAPVVLVHGVGLRAEAWGGVQPELSRSFSVYAVDMPGHGRSPAAGAKTLQHYVQRISDLIETLGRPVCLAGHSMGALISLEIAGAMPDRIAAVAALNAVFRRTSEASEAVRNRAASLSGTSFADPAETLQRWFGVSPEGDEADAAAACRQWLTTGDPKGYRAAYSVFAGSDGPADGTLRQISCPLLCMTGSDDLNSTPEMSENLAALAPDGRACVLPEAAHMMPMTHGSRTADVLEQFFKTGATAI